jgi:hypothetical protein
MTRKGGRDDAARSDSGGGGEGAAGGSAPGRRFVDEGGRWWEVTWRSPAADPGGPPFGSYRFRAVEDGSEHVIAAGSRSGARLAQMSLADVRQLLGRARGGGPAGEA